MHLQVFRPRDIVVVDSSFRAELALKRDLAFLVVYQEGQGGWNYAHPNHTEDGRAGLEAEKLAQLFSGHIESLKSGIVS